MHNLCKVRGLIKTSVHVNNFRYLREKGTTDCSELSDFSVVLGIRTKSVVLVRVFRG